MRATGSSSTWSRTSTSSSTSDGASPPPPHRATLLGTVRLAHPFPSLLDGAATFSIAMLAGGSLAVAFRLAVSMVCLQASIGALNDLTDAPLDAGRKRGKPIPAGTASPAAARTVAAVGLVAGLAASAPSGVATVAVAVLGAGCGYAYDLRLSRTPWSWLPLAIALPLLPIHAWLGATGSLPSVLPALVPIGVLAGAGLALANGIADHERDLDAGTSTAVVRLGRSLAWRLHVVALASAVTLAVIVAPGAMRRPVGWGIVAGTAIIALGALLARGVQPGVRERGWEAEAVGVVVLGASWLAAAAGL